MDKDAVIGLIVVVVILLVVASCIFYTCGVSVTKNQALKNKCGYWYLDDKCDKQWKWGIE